MAAKIVADMAEMERGPVPSSEESTFEEDDSSQSSSCLSLHYSSSPFEGDGSSDEEVDSQRSVVPYSYEPEMENISDSETGISSDDESRREERLLNTEW